MASSISDQILILKLYVLAAAICAGVVFYLAWTAVRIWKERNTRS